MTKCVWIIWVAIELAAVLMLAALWPANASAAPKWECTSAGGWSMAIDGRRTSIPISDVATVLELSAPDKMRVLNAGSEIERKIYQSMSWEKRGGKSTGPRTDEGRQRIAKAHFQHGRRSKSYLQQRHDLKVDSVIIYN